MKADIAEVRTDVAHLQDDMREVKTGIRDLQVALQANVRTFVVTQTSTVIAVAGIVLAVDRLL